MAVALGLLEWSCHHSHKKASGLDSWAPGTQGAQPPTTGKMAVGLDAFLQNKVSIDFLDWVTLLQVDQEGSLGRSNLERFRFQQY